MNEKFVDRLFIGIIIIAIGVVFLLNQLGYDISIGYIFSNFWPVIMILLGFGDLMKRRGFSFWSLLMIALGAIFLGRNLDLIDWGIGDIIGSLWPIAIIAVGISMIWKPKRKSNHKPPVDEWEAYSSFESNTNVPPAPPLHPDPTKPPFFNDEEQAKHKSNESSQTHGKQTSYDYNQHKHHGQSYQSYNKKEHVEWWNHGGSDTQTRSGFIGDIHIGEDYWDLKPLNISHFIGDTVLDLTKAHVEYGETRITISSFIGDVKVYVPNDYEIGVQVQSSAFIGDVKILGRKEGGLFNNVNIASPTYHEADKKIKLVVSTFIGDVRVTKVG